jgi:hypothetical protein
MRKSVRTVKAPEFFAQEQEKETERRAKHQQHKQSLTATTLRGNTPVEQEIGTDRAENQSNASQTESQKLLAELVSLRVELHKRDILHQEEVKRIRAEFGKALAEVQRELEEIKSGISTQTSTESCPCEGHEGLRQELQSLRSAITTPSTADGQRTWASVVASRSATHLDTTISGAINKRRDREANCIRISTQLRHDLHENESDRAFSRYLPIDAANTHIRGALLNTDATKDIKIAGVGTTKTGYVIRFKDPESADIAKSNTQWLEELGNGTKLVRPRFGVVVHRTPTEEFLLPENEREGIAKIMEENELAAKGYQVNEIAWLRRKDKSPSRSSSLGIWFDTPQAAEWIINNGLIVGQRYIGSIEPYQVKKKRCHRCQRFGHLAWSCKEKPRCGHCTGEHERRNCPPGVKARCLDCSGDHPTGYRRCPEPANPPSSQ